MPTKRDLEWHGLFITQEKLQKVVIRLTKITFVFKERAKGGTNSELKVHGNTL